jgi:hypothetical protein
MRKLLPLIFILSSILFTKSYAQCTYEFARLCPEDFKLKSYSKDASAEAVILYDIGKCYFLQTDEGFNIIFERKTKIKIFNKAGLKWAQVEIPYYEENNKSEEIRDLAGFTYNYENNVLRKTPLDPNTAFTEKANNHWRNLKFAMPDVKDSSIIEYKYRIQSPYIFNFRGWEFQNKIPTIYSSYEARMIPFYEYTYIMQGTSKFDEFSKERSRSTNQFQSITYEDMIYKFGMKDIPAFKDEAFISSYNDYILKLDFQLSAIHRPNGSNEKIMTTWPQLIEELQDNEDLGRYLKSCQKKAREIIDTMQLTTKSIQERTEIIDRYVKRNYNWNGSSDKFATKSAKDFLKTKIGNSANINLFLVGMLNAAGVNAYPVIISTRDHGKIRSEYPFHHFFNYVVAVASIGDRVVLLDATDPLSNFAEIPIKCFNDKGLIIKSAKEPQWINFQCSEKSLTKYNFELTPLVEKDTTQSFIKISSTGYDALDLRKKYLKSSKDFKDELKIDMLNLSDSIKINNLKEIDKPFDIALKANIGIDKIEDKLMIAPFCNMVISDNPLKQRFRTYPIDMINQKEKSFTSIIHIPEGYKLLNTPSNINIDNDNVKIYYNVQSVNDNTVLINATYSFKKNIYNPIEYSVLKEYYKTIIEKLNDQIIMIKK